HVPGPRYAARYAATRPAAAIQRNALAHVPKAARATALVCAAERRAPGRRTQPARLRTERQRARPRSCVLPSDARRAGERNPPAYVPKGSARDRARVCCRATRAGQANATRPPTYRKAARATALVRAAERRA